MRIARSVSVATLGMAACLAFGSCAKNPAVELVLVDGCIGNAPPDPNTDCQRPPCPDGVDSFRSVAAYAEVAVFDGGCPSDDDLIVGDTSKARFHAVVPATDKLPAIGDLSKDTYGFAAVLRDSNCGVIAMGCTTADLNSIRRVNVSVRAWRTDAHPHDNVCAPYTPDQGCVAPLTCVEGKCVGEGGVPDGSSPGDCDLSVVASGTLPAAISADAQVTGPAVAATSDGFVLVYRQLDPTSGKVQLVSLKLPDSGTLGAPSTADLEGCASQAPTDGLGLAFSGTTGLLAAGLQDCSGTGAGAGAAFIPVGTDGKLSSPNSLRNPSFTELKLAQGHSLSARPNIVPDGGSSTPAFDFAYRAIQAGSTLVQVGVLAYAKFSGSPTSMFTETADYGMVATTDKLQALLGRVPSRGADIFKVTGNAVTPTPPPQDAGSEASTEGGTEGGTEAGTDSGTSSNGEFVLPDSPTWAAVTAADDRAAAVVPGGGAGLTLQVADATGKDLGKSNLVGGVFQSGDVAFTHDHLIVVGGSANNLVVYRVDGATTASTVSATGATKVEYKDALGKASLSDFDGARLSMAAARDHVVVVWLSSLALSQGVPTGGWAMLSCKK